MKEIFLFRYVADAIWNGALSHAIDILSTVKKKFFILNIFFYGKQRIKIYNFKLLGCP